MDVGYQSRSEAKGLLIRDVTIVHSSQASRSLLVVSDRSATSGSDPRTTERVRVIHCKGINKRANNVKSMLTSKARHAAGLPLTVGRRLTVLSYPTVPP